MSKRMVKITTEGVVSVVDGDGLATKQTEVGGYVAFTEVYQTEGRWTMVYHDEAKVYDEDVNALASLLFGTPWHGDPIAGDVLVGITDDTDVDDRMGDDPDIAAHVLELTAKLVAAAMLR